MTASTALRTRPSTRRPPRGTRRFGYLLAAAINGGLIWVLVGSPGWRSAGFLTDDFARVVGWIVASLVAGIVVNLLYVVADPRWGKRLGDAVTAAFAAAALGRLWIVFPFVFSERWADWEGPFHVIVGVLCIATAIGVLANLAALVRSTVGDAGAR
jgi:hypothetical protein